jgi:hypothetical protein
MQLITTEPSNSAGNTQQGDRQNRSKFFIHKQSTGNKVKCSSF